MSLHKVSKTKSKCIDILRRWSTILSLIEIDQIILALLLAERRHSPIVLLLLFVSQNKHQSFPNQSD